MAIISLLEYLMAYIADVDTPVVSYMRFSYQEAITATHQKWKTCRLKFCSIEWGSRQLLSFDLVLYCFDTFPAARQSLYHSIRESNNTNILGVSVATRGERSPSDPYKPMSVTTFWCIRDASALPTCQVRFEAQFGVIFGRGHRAIVSWLRL